MIRFLQHPSTGRKAGLSIILGVLILGMVVYLGQAFTGSGNVNTSGVYATVGDETVTSSEVSKMAQQMGRQQFQGRAVPEFILPYFQQRAAEQLVTQKALNVEAERLGLSVSDAELAQELHSGDWGKQIFPNGQFIGQDKYTELVATNFDLDIPTFEKLVKQSLLQRKLLGSVQGSVLVPANEVEKEFARQNEKVKFEYAVISATDLMKKVSVTDAELRAFYDKNKAQWKDAIPEQRRVKYVVLDPSAAQVQVSDDDLKRAYNQRQDQFKTPEQVDVRHILVKTKEQALDIKKQLQAGAKFDDLAKKYSEDPGSKDKGGLYQNVVRNQMVPAFDQVAFSLKPGEISDPVQTSFGFHIIKVDAHRQAQVKPLEKVRGELEPIVRAEKAGNSLQTLANTLTTEAKTQGLEAAAAKHNLKVVNTEYVAQTAQLPGVGQSPEFMGQIFALKANSTPEQLRTQQGFAVAQVLDSKAARTPSFEEYRAQVEQQFRNERATQMLSNRTQELADRAKSMHDLKRAAKELGAPVKTSDFVNESANVPDVGAMSGAAQVAFAMQPGQISDAISSGRNGVVLQLLDKQQPSMTELESKREEIREGLLQRKRNEVVQIFADQLRAKLQKEGKIKINQEEQKRLFGKTAGAPGSGPAE